MQNHWGNWAPSTGRQALKNNKKKKRVGKIVGGNKTNGPEISAVVAVNWKWEGNINKQLCRDQRRKMKLLQRTWVWMKWAEVPVVVELLYCFIWCECIQYMYLVFFLELALFNWKIFKVVESQCFSFPWKNYREYFYENTVKLWSPRSDVNTGDLPQILRLTSVNTRLNYKNTQTQ